MLRTIKRLLIGIVVLGLFATALIYGVLTLSLPELSGRILTTSIVKPSNLDRDVLGHAVITANSREDASFSLGYAHGQDRFFQMDLLRRNAAGELGELFGPAAVGLDKAMRFHRLRKHSELILEQLPEKHRVILQNYSAGVNLALAHSHYDSFEYLLTGAEREPWRPEDSLLVIFSMYLDLQTNSINRDQVLTYINHRFGSEMVRFLTQPSKYQAALDGSEFELVDQPIPKLHVDAEIASNQYHIEEPNDLGSNNWAVTGVLTQTGHSMLADDMHLGLNVPVIWYRTQLNYMKNKRLIQVTGVSLPGAPAIVVGSNGHIAWGFTNAYIDTVDWIHLNDTVKTHTVSENIHTPDGKQEYQIELSKYGPVKHIGGERYALKWVAHENYAVNMKLIDLELALDVEQGLNVSKNVGIPVQNMLIVDKSGNAAWQAVGAIPNRQTPTKLAITPEQFDSKWQQHSTVVPFLLNPEHGRLWTGNSRVVSVEQDARFGNGGYALGARSAQIKKRLFEKETFTEQDFYDIQLDNQSLFLAPWQQLLLKVLNADPQKYADDITQVENWGQCACPDSVGYTLVRKYRSAVIDRLFSPIEHALQEEGLSLKSIKRDLEPATWQLINSFTDEWLPADEASWPAFLVTTYADMKKQLLVQFTGKATSPTSALTWGKVNELNIQHPFSKQIPFLSKLLDMPKAAAFGDSFMPAVQGTSFGASQRLFVQPGKEENAVLTLPGGQSGHPLSPYYRAGYVDYIEQKNTPLLPGEIINRIEFLPMSN